MMRNLPIRSLPIPRDRYWLKCPYKLIPEGITIHNTYNSVSAMAEASFSAGNDWETSSHVYIDEKEVVLSVPFDLNAWHAGDGGSGYGNRKTLCFEICRSRSDLETYKKAEANGALYTAMTLHQKGWGLDKVYPHRRWSGKYCPHRTLDLGWDRFMRMVENYYIALKDEAKKPAPKPKKEKEVKPTFGVFASSSVDDAQVDRILYQVKGAVKYDRSRTPEEMFEKIVQVGGKKLREHYILVAGGNRAETDKAVSEWIEKNK